MSLFECIFMLNTLFCLIFEHNSFFIKKNTDFTALGKSSFLTPSLSKIFAVPHIIHIFLPVFDYFQSKII